MYCKNCGADIAPGTLFCGNCGMRVSEETTAEAEAQSGTYEAPAEPIQQGEYQSQPQPPQNPAKPEKSCNPVLWIVLSAVETLLCCQFIPGIIGLIFAIMGSSSKSEGDFEKARKYCRYAMIAVIIGAVLAVICAIGLIVLSVFSSIEMINAVGEYAPYASDYFESGMEAFGYFDPSEFVNY